MRMVAQYGARAAQLLTQGCRGARGSLADHRAPSAVVRILERVYGVKG